MKGENYLYFQDDAAEANATDEAVMIPASRVLGMSVGAADGTGDNDAFYLSYESLTNTGAARGSVLIACTADKQKEAMDDVAAAMNSTVGDGFVVMCDVLNSIFCSPHITGCTINTTV
jgi:nitrogen regulatory protein PII